MSIWGLVVTCFWVVRGAVEVKQHKLCENLFWGGLFPGRMFFRNLIFMGIWVMYVWCMFITRSHISDNDDWQYIIAKHPFALDCQQKQWFWVAYSMREWVPEHGFEHQKGPRSPPSPFGHPAAGPQITQEEIMGERRQAAGRSCHDLVCPKCDEVTLFQQRN